MELLEKRYGAQELLSGKMGEVKCSGNKPPPGLSGL